MTTPSFKPRSPHIHSAELRYKLFVNNAATTVTKERRKEDFMDPVRQIRGTSQSRREFFQKSAAAGAALWAAPAIVRAGGSPSERVRVAVVGLGNRGDNHIEALRRIDNVEVAALCDVYEPRLNQWADRCQDDSGKRPATYVDYRKLLDDDSIDAVSIVTPDHWHALQVIWGCQAGKDVYCEKVGAHNLTESRMMVDAARRHDRIVQHGTQARSNPTIREGIGKLHEGVIGQISMARAIAYKCHAGLRNQFAPVPQGLHWDLWLGPAPQRPFNKPAFGAKWRFIKEYGNGMLGAQGVHQLDLIRWALKLDRHPAKIQAMGGMYSRPTTDATLPDELTVAYRFDDPDVMVTFETRAGYTNQEAGMGRDYHWVNPRQIVGAVFFGSDGYMVMPNLSSYYTFLGHDYGRKYEPGPSAAGKGGSVWKDDEHFQNWIAAIRARDRTRLNAEIAEGHLSSSLVYLGNIAWETERTLQFDPDAETILGDEEARQLLTSEYRKPFTLPSQV